MKDIAGIIRIERAGRHTSITIDGVEFPWHISSDGPSVTVTNDDMPAVTLRIVADRIEVVDDIDGPTAVAPPPTRLSWWRRLARTIHHFVTPPSYRPGH